MYVIIVGLIDLLADVLGRLESDHLHKLREAVLRPELLIVLAHHSSEDIRVAVVKVHYTPHTRLCNSLLFF